MFGYIKPLKPELRVVDNDFYQAIYCGLCKDIKKHFGLLSTFTLNYDFVFLALIYMSVNDVYVEIGKQRCTGNPFKKKEVVEDDCLLFCSSILMLSAYYKLDDNKFDNGIKDKLLGYIMSLPIKKSTKKVKEQFEDINVALKNFTEKQRELELKKESSIDIICDPTAVCTGEIFSKITEDKTKKLILNRMGYFVGRWVYLIDAFDDLNDDIERNNYNPFIYKYNIKSVDDIKNNNIYNDILLMLNSTIAEIVNCYNLLDIRLNKDLLDNIIFLGFKNTQLYIKKSKEGNK